MASLFMRVLDIHFENREKGVAPLTQRIFKITVTEKCHQASPTNHSFYLLVFAITMILINNVYTRMKVIP